MNNKKLGTDFEREVVRLLAKEGWWVHFISPDASGAQPFDIIAVQNGRAIAIDCKTSVTNNFPISRLEENQIFAFDKWGACGNGTPYVFVKYGNDIYAVPYEVLRENGRVHLNEHKEWLWSSSSEAK